MIEVILNAVKNLLNQYREAIPHLTLNVECSAFEVQSEFTLLVLPAVPALSDRRKSKGAQLSRGRKTAAEIFGLGDAQILIITAVTDN
jgi:hypothetical protein